MYLKSADFFCLIFINFTLGLFNMRERAQDKAALLHTRLCAAPQHILQGYPSESEHGL